MYCTGNVNDLHDVYQYVRPFTGTIYRYTRGDRNPWDASGYAGRYNGNGTQALYFGDSPQSAWAEITHHVPDASKADYRLWAYPVQETNFIDVGLFDNVQDYLVGSAMGGYNPTQKLRSAMKGTNTAGIRYPSYPAYIGSHSGTSFCIYPDVYPVRQDGFQEVSC